MARDKAVYRVKPDVSGLHVVIQLAEDPNAEGPQDRCINIFLLSWEVGSGLSSICHVGLGLVFRPRLNMTSTISVIGFNSISASSSVEYSCA